MLLAIRPLPAAAQVASPPRPELPNEETHQTAHFLIHFTRTGEHAVDPTDTDGDGLPDYVERVAETLEINWQTQVVDYGWAPPPPDGGLGGSDLLDVYLENLMADGIAGYINTEGGFVGDNPLTPEVEHYAAASYMSIDNDFIEIADQADNTGETPFDLMRATVTHEFNHALQSGYDNFDPHFWLYEASATWMEQEVFDDVNNGIFYLDALFSSSDTCLVALSGRLERYDHWYAEWLFLRYLSETYGPELIRTIWEQSRSLDGFEAIDAALAPLGSSLQEATRDFAIANLLRDYDHGDLYPVVRLEGETGTGTFTPSDGIQSLGADYVRLTGEGIVTVRLSQTDAPMSLAAVGLIGDQAQEIVGQENAVTVNLDRYEDTFIVVHNGERVVDGSLCQYIGYTLDINISSDFPSPVAGSWSAANYRLPGTEYIPMFESSGYQPPGDIPFAEDEADESPIDMEVSFDPLVPTNLPAGYIFVYDYVMNAEEFGPEQIYYVPGGGDSANYDYQGDSGNWLRIAESTSPYATLNEWLAGIDYDSPGELLTVNGVEVLSEDLSEQGKVWINMTLIYKDLFIVVDATREDGDMPAARDDALALIKGLIQEGGPPPEPESVSGTAAPTQEFVPLPEAEIDNQAGGGRVGIGLAVLGFGIFMVAFPVTLTGVFLWLRERKQVHTG